jgi:hypothetical protein
VNNPSGSSSESFVTQALNVGIEVFSVVMSFLTRGALQIHSELPGGENVGRTSFSEAIASIFGNDDVSDERSADGASPGTVEG